MITPVKYGTADDELLTMPIRGLEKEAQAKISEHVHDLKEIKHSLKTETASNVAFVLAGIALSLPDLDRAMIGAAAVYVPLAYQFYRAASDKNALIDHQREMKHGNKGTKTFDDMGLTFRGNRPLLEADSTDPLIDLSKICKPVTFTPSNNWGILGSAVDYLRYTAHDLVALPARKVESVRKQNFKDSAADFKYTDNPDQSGERVLCTRMSDINNSAVVQMPADPVRIQTSLAYTKKSMIPEYIESAFNFVGICGAAEFCHVVGSDAVRNVAQAVESHSVTPLAVAGIWGVTTLIGAGPLKHFMDNAKTIHQRLKTKWQVVNVKNDAIDELTKTYWNIESDVYRHENTEDETLRAQYLENLSDLVGKIDPPALSQKARNFLHDHRLLPKPPNEEAAPAPSA